jgi:hypothetical protein
MSRGTPRALRRAIRLRRAEQAAYDEARVQTREEETRRFHRLVVEGAEHDRRCLHIIEHELPAIREGFPEWMRGNQ